jgi:hypothetical protein
MDSEYSIKIAILSDSGERTYEAIAMANSSFFLDYKMYLFGENDEHIGWGYFNLKSIIDDGSKIKVISVKESVPKLREHIELPDEIVSNFKEAFGCYLDGYYQASVVISRRLLEQVLISKGATPKQRICDMIKELTKRGILDSKLSDLADDIKHLGNIGAHVKEEEANKSDAETTLHFSDFLITWLFGQVQEVSRRKNQRNIDYQ